MGEGLETKPGSEAGPPDEGLQDLFAGWKSSKFLRRDRHGVILKSGPQGLPGIIDREFEVVVLGVFAHLFEHSDRDGRVGPGRRNHGFQADLGMGIVRQAEEMTVSSGKLLRPVTEKMCGGRPAVIIPVSRNLQEKFRVDPAPLLMKPK